MKSKKRKNDEGEREFDLASARGVDPWFFGSYFKGTYRITVSSREYVSFSHVTRILRYRIDITEKDNGTLTLARVRRNSSRSRCFLIEETEDRGELRTKYTLHLNIPSVHTLYWLLASVHSNQRRGEVRFLLLILFIVLLIVLIYLFISAISFDIRQFKSRWKVNRRNKKYLFKSFFSL